MNRIFDVVQSLAGQKNVIVIPVPYLDFFKSDQQSHMLAAILNQLVYWSGIPSSLDDGWFYKDYEELASEIRGVTADQVRKAAKKIIQNYLPGVIESTTRKVNGVPKKHWRLNGSALIARIFPQALVPTQLSNGNGQEAKSEGQRGELDSAVLPDGNGQEAESYLYADHYTDRNIQIKKTVGQSPAATDPQPVDSLKIDYLEVLEAYHATLPEMPRVLDMTQDRRTKLYALWEKYDLSQGRWAAYLRYIAKNCRWMLEDRPDPVFGKTWRRKSFDYLITEKCYLSVKELRANDLPKVLKIDAAARQDAFERLVSHPGKPQNARRGSRYVDGTRIGAHE